MVETSGFGALRTGALLHHGIAYAVFSDERGLGRHGL